MADTDAFFRTEMLPPKEPPLSQRGVWKWMHENMFSSIGSGALTVLGILFVLYVLASAFPWFAHSVWHADSLRQCRDIVHKTWGPGTDGACWAVIRANWNLYLYGFYPMEQIWRPNLAFLLLLVALSPILFSRLPRKMIWFSACYPALAYWLIWGGTLWISVTIMAGFAVGALVLRFLGRIAGTALGVGGAVLGAVLWWLFVAAPVATALADIVPLHLTFVPSDKLGGFLLSFITGMCGIGFSLPMGILLSLGRRSDMPIIKTSCVLFIEFVRGVPLITLLFTASFLLAYFLPPGTTFDLVLRVIIMVTLFSAAYIAEVIRGGLAAIPRGQFEAADALGLDYWKAQRLIVMPQALKISIPGIVGVFIGLFKDTTLVIIVGLLDPLMGISNAVRANVAWNGVYWEPYIFAATIFFIFCFGMSRYSMYLEGKLKTDHR
ncbi:amino acid ABC transporter permease [Solirhodobacter olei]|uniref:amino acid ABC transporter permease n=1 Tax=Solirhodobacter olei TaxID=2493082 RepID=UPI000FDA25EA|nr:amino acid ABC transporter permease [Solirhodobacter olei]